MRPITQLRRLSTLIVGIILKLYSYCYCFHFIFFIFFTDSKNVKAKDRTEVQLRCILLFLFDKGLKPKEATKNVIVIYEILNNIRKCKRWFKQFKNGDRNLKFSLHAALSCCKMRRCLFTRTDRFFSYSAFNLSYCTQ